MPHKPLKVYIGGRKKEEEEEERKKPPLFGESHFFQFM